MLLERRSQLKRTGFKRKPAKTLEADIAWSDAVLLRDEFRCTFPHDGRNCACWGKPVAHHVILRRYTKTRWDVDNGTTLCVPAHAYVHGNPDWSRRHGLLGRPRDRVTRGRAFPL